MKPATAKAKGTATETTFVTWLRQWVPHAERRRLHGNADRGDIAGLPGVVLEVKSGARVAIAQWLAELETEIDNDQADTGAVIVRPPKQPGPDNWYAVMPLPLWRELMTAAGWIAEQETP